MIEDKNYAVEKIKSKHNKNKNLVYPTKKYRTMNCKINRKIK